MQEQFPAKIISGGQLGADIAGLDAATHLGLETGGTAPKGYLVCTYEGAHVSYPLLSIYGLVEHSSSSYPPRTKQNVQDADATVWFGYTDSPGGKLTLKTARELNKPYIINPSSTELREWLIEEKVKVLNVAGNRYSPDNPNIYKRVYGTLMEALGS